MILSHFGPILLCSKKAVKDAIQGVLHGILEKHHRTVQEQQKLVQALPIMAEAISSIVSSSTDREFRRKCFHGLQVADTQEFQVAIKETFNKVILKQWKPSRTCDIRTPLPQNNEAGWLSADVVLHTTQQKPLCSSSFAEVEREGKDSYGKEELLCNRSEFEGLTQLKKRRPTSREFLVADSEEPNVTSEVREEREGFSTQPDTSCFSNTKSQAIFGNDETLWQDEDFWNQEVSNLAEWTF
ncbi:type 2 DNA topoisomerase 6 subunit B-like [Sceloporus undulatus]|uniref:type 2 DNA topoisomerase 6 subunit B-like n=1 Tax=Sceloporus undulatus TaxID=8520 RepID=UPI001C4D68A1|nr:type 2 DNA topoisomerase 6 subunit B-like [Sceloporus undulatus]